MDKRFLVFYALAAAVLLWLIFPNNLWGLFSAVLLAAGCGALEEVHPLFRPASFSGAGMALLLLLGRTGIFSASLGTILLQLGSMIAFCLLALALAALERAGGSIPLVSWTAIVIMAIGGIYTVLFALEFPGAVAVIGSPMPTIVLAERLGKIMLLLAVFRAQRALIQKGE